MKNVNVWLMLHCVMVRFSRDQSVKAVNWNVVIGNYLGLLMYTKLY